MNLARCCDVTRQIDDLQEGQTRVPRSSKVYEENPGRLKRLLKSIRKDIVGCTQPEMVKKLNGAERLPGRNSFNLETVKNIENGRRIITYYHVSVYGDLLDVPTGILLLFSRYSVTQMHRERSFQDFNLILEKFALINEERLKGGGALTISDLKTMSDFVRTNLGPRPL
jgi:hypothetical protein